ncbi:MAG TPA: YfhO family protein, partial [Thermoanaerobaculia bacterium]|nr:YfhO family protein [Thermoanaerobaculia bacterium]
EEGARGGEAWVAGRAPGFWGVNLKAPSLGTLAVAETWDAGWSATLNGKPVAVKPYRGILLGVQVGPGPGHVELRYRPDGFVAGTALSLLGLAAVGVGWIWRRTSASSD